MSPKILVFLFLLSVLGNTGVTSSSRRSLVEMFRQGCPYTNMCTLPSLKVSNDTESSRPCCMDCFCDPICSSYGDCCPDIMEVNDKINLGSTDSIPVCKTSAWSNSYTEANSDRFFHVLPRYRLIDDCPFNFDVDIAIIQRCRGNFSDDPSYGDIVHVSDRSNRLFQNKYCAICHNALDIIRWNLMVVSCTENIGGLDFSHASLHQFVLQNCAVVSMRPQNVALNSRTMACHVESTCPYEFANEDIKNGCVNGPYMPFAVVHDFFTQFWKNIQCFKCRVGRQPDNICPNEIEDVDLSVEGSAIFQLDLSVKRLHTEQQDVTCPEMETFDPHAGFCRRVYCPQMTVISLGKCVPISSYISPYVISVDFIFTPESNNTRTEHFVEPYSTRLKQFYAEQVYNLTTTTGCVPFLFYVFVSTGKILGNLQSVRILLHYEINNTCSLHDIAAMIEKANSKYLIKRWAINKDFVRMKGRFSFFDLPQTTQTQKKYLLFFETTGQYPREVTQKFFVCPYFLFNVDEYKKHIAKLGFRDSKTFLTDLAPTTNLVDGYFPLSEKTIAVCVEKYLRVKSSGRTIGLRAKRILMIVTFMLVIHDRF